MRPSILHGFYFQTASGHRRRKIRRYFDIVFIHELLNLGQISRVYIPFLMHKASLHNAAWIVVIIGTPFILGDYQRILRGINFTTGGSDCR